MFLVPLLQHPCVHGTRYAYHTISVLGLVNCPGCGAPRHTRVLSFCDFSVCPGTCPCTPSAHCLLNVSVTVILCSSCVHGMVPVMVSWPMWLLAGLVARKGQCERARAWANPAERASPCPEPCNVAQRSACRQCLSCRSIVVPRLQHGYVAVPCRLCTSPQSGFSAGRFSTCLCLKGRFLANDRQQGMAVVGCSVLRPRPRFIHAGGGTHVQGTVGQGAASPAHTTPCHAAVHVPVHVPDSSMQVSPHMPVRGACHIVTSTMLNQQNLGTGE